MRKCKKGETGCKERQINEGKEIRSKKIKKTHSKTVTLNYKEPRHISYKTISASSGVSDQPTNWHFRNLISIGCSQNI